MDLSYGARDPYFAAATCSLLYNWSESPTLVAVDDLVDGFLGQTARIDEFLEGNGNVRMGLASANGVSLFLFLGATQPLTVANAVGGWLQPRDRRMPTGFCNSFFLQAELAAARHISQLGPIQQRVIIAGYSCGGAVGQALGTALANSNQANIVTVVTFGQPRPGDDRIVFAGRRVDYHAYWNEGDNVRFCPPNNREALVMHLLLTRDESLTVNQLGQLDQATKISFDEQLSLEPANNEGAGITDLSLAAFLSTNEAATSVNHSLAEYNRRLQIWEVRNPPAPVRPRAANNVGVPGVFVPPVQPIPPAVARPREPTSADVPPRRQVAKLPRPPYRAVKVGKIWTVEYNGDTVYVAKVKTEAKRFALRMNSAYGLWRGAKAFDGPAFTESVANLFQT